jgi:hypothetical protein
MNKDQLLNGNGRVEWERKSDETNKKTKKKEGNREYMHKECPYKTRTRDIEETKNYRERRKKGREVKVGYRKITIEGVQWRWNEKKGRLEIF